MPRPSVSWTDGFGRILLLVGSGIAVALVAGYIWPSAVPYRTVISESATIALALATARSNAVLAIRLYQRYAPPHVRARCAMTPTCSEYALLAIRRHGVLSGLRMTYSRLRHRCNGTPVTDFP